MLALASSGFQNGESIPAKYTCEGEGVSPSLTISGVPENAQSLVLLMDDPDAVGGTFDHFVLFNIPPDTTEIPEGGSVGQVGKNSGGRNDYYHPCPPRGHEPEEHRYSFRLYALDALLPLKPGAMKEEVMAAMEGHILEKAELMGRYRKKE